MRLPARGLLVVRSVLATRASHAALASTRVTSAAIRALLVEHVARVRSRRFFWSIALSVSASGAVPVSRRLSAASAERADGRRAIDGHARARAQHLFDLRRPARHLFRQT